MYIYYRNNIPTPSSYIRVFIIMRLFGLLVLAVLSTSSTGTTVISDCIETCTATVAAAAAAADDDDGEQVGVLRSTVQTLREQHASQVKELESCRVQTSEDEILLVRQLQDNLTTEQDQVSALLSAGVIVTRLIETIQGYQESIEAFQQHIRQLENEQNDNFAKTREQVQLLEDRAAAAVEETEAMKREMDAILNKKKFFVW